MDIQIGSEEELNKISNSLFDFNKAIVAGFNNQSEPFVTIRYVIREKEVLIAGILGQIVINNVIYIDDLFVDELHRRYGYATALLQKLEQEAKSRGCYLAWLYTLNSEAVPFYEKSGYDVFAKLENAPAPGVTTFYMKKLLKEAK